MKKLLTLSLVLSMFIFASCEKTETFDDTRRIDNETAFAKIETNSEFKKIESLTGEGYIMYKVITEGDSKIKPLFTDKVKVYYTGWYKQLWTKDDIIKEENGLETKNKVIFDSTDNRGGVASVLTVNELIDGYTTALQHMNVGDKWEVWIPWNMGYGGGMTYNPTVARGMPEYTTLVFEIELKEVVGVK